MKKIKVTHNLTLRNVGAFFALSTLPALAQSGHTINSIDTRPGTTAPANPMDPGQTTTRSPTDKVLINGEPSLGASHTVSAHSDLNRDAGSAKGDRKALRKKDHRLNKVIRGQDLPNTEERNRNMPGDPPIPH